jgi:hypothetical protein
MTVPILPPIPIGSRAVGPQPAEIADLRIVPSARFASLLAGLQLTDNYSAAAALAKKHLDWLQQQIADPLSSVPKFGDFVVVVAGRNQLATVFISPEMVRECIDDKAIDWGAAAEAMRLLLDCCGTKPRQRRSGDPAWSLACVAALLATMSPAETAGLRTELEQCRERGFSGCIVGLLDTKSASSLWPLFLRLAAPSPQPSSPQPSLTQPSLTQPQHPQQRLGAFIPPTMSAEPPRIHAVDGGAGTPRRTAVPERHADRVVAEMLRWIVAERQQRMTALRGILSSTPDANPQDQQCLVDKFERIGGPFFQLVTLMESRKRGRYKIRILSIVGWNRDARAPILSRDEIPERPQLAASVLTVKGLGNHRHDIETNVELIVSHHALSRLVQRSANRTVDDLLASVVSLFVTSTIDAGLSLPENSRLRFQTNGGEVIAQLERTAAARSSPRRSWKSTILEISARNLK